MANSAENERKYEDLKKIPNYKKILQSRHYYNH